MSRVALLGSPFLGPEIWAPVAGCLERRGQSAIVVTGVGDAPDEVLASMLAELPSDDELVLVPHSNAGLYAAALALTRRVRAIVFVDALLPGPGGHTAVTTADLAEWLTDMAESGRLPVWSSWWPEASVAALFPDAATRVRVEAGQPRMPLSYLQGRVATPRGWERLPCAYLGFGATYAEEQNTARRNGWPVIELDGGHLHQLVDPEGVAEAILHLLAVAA
ncbi:MAG: alpha/beta fold hydrolase [Actinomycetota bacterium]|nr:alpha/beta fold hydrolase [Actinomycetota bacterium]MDQ6935069.1 alpha/beta fold hydrolase [Actinomycetota bacterium]